MRELVIQEGGTLSVRYQTYKKTSMDIRGHINFDKKNTTTATAATTTTIARTTTAAGITTTTTILTVSSTIIYRSFLSPTFTMFRLITALAFISAAGAIPVDNGVEGEPEIECGPTSVTINFNTRNPFEGVFYCVFISPLQF